ncbi:MAG: T9SS type A sorting domain-containing protein [Bacteroidia bacterium]|nr:T9SS type A sorting domain-containing protein [Bacteroidia bacterium]
MKKGLLFVSFVAIICSVSFAQDNWQLNSSNGIGNPYNSTINAMHSFGGHMYLGMGTDQGVVLRSANAAPGTWSEVFSEPYFESIDAINSTTEGGGYIYFSGKGFDQEVPTIYRSADGLTWAPYYRSIHRLTHIIPFKGLGSVDSIYIIEEGYDGSNIWKAAYDNNDPDNALSTWTHVLSMDTLSSYLYVVSAHVHSGKLYLGTNQGTLYTTQDGLNYTMNAGVGVGFGNFDNYEISAIGAFGGYVYAATFNYYIGSQLYRTNNGVTWDSVTTFTSHMRTTNIDVHSGELWICLETENGNGANVLRSTDGVSFTTSTNDGFGEPNQNAGQNGKTIQYGSNIFYGGRYYAFGGKGGRGSLQNEGARLYQLCVGTPPVVNLGIDQTVCQNVSLTFDAGSGNASYWWSTEDTTQTITTSNGGDIYVIVVGTNGCIASDTVNVNHLTTPSVTIVSPQMDTLVCSGTSISLLADAASGVRNPLPPIHKPTYQMISDYSYSYDTISVSGITDSAGLALYSVTIDSLVHTYVGDIQMWLIAPNGSSIQLYSQHGSGSDDIYGMELNTTSTNDLNTGTGPFTGTWMPYEPFSNLTGTANGDWKLEMYDAAGGDIGELRGWSIRFSEADNTVNYSWAPAASITSATNLAAATAQVTSSTTYTVTVSNSFGCTATAERNIFVPTINITVMDDTLCYGESTLMIAMGQNITWSETGSGTLSSTFGQTVTASPIATTIYYATDTIMGCPVIDSATVYYSPQFFATASPAQTICYSESATLSSTVSGGMTPYQYLWSDGAAFSGTNATELVAPLTTTSYTLYAFDAYNCLATDVTNITVNPSTDVFGHVTFTGGNVTNGTVVLYNHYPFFTSFDTVQTVALNANGDFHFTSVIYGDYIVKVFANNTAFPTLLPTYYGNVYLWGSASILPHGCALNDTLVITMSEQQALTGPGQLSGTVIEGPGFGRLEGDPIPGIDVKLGRNPGGQLVTSTETDNNGDYNFSNLPNGSYTVYVDIPGLGLDSTYTVEITDTTNNYPNLDYEVDTNSVYPVNQNPNSISNLDFAKATKFSVYPNPFKSGLNITYALSQDAEMRLEIYSVLGIKVQSIVNKNQQAGEYRYTFDDQIQSGVYFISLTVDGKTSTQRVIKID